jgi:hypothetical protein
MNVSEIRRTHAAPVIIPEPTIMEEAKEVLGYGRERTITKPERVSTLAAKLADLDIDTLNQSDVVRYQCEMAAEKFLEPEFHRELASGGTYYRWHLTVWDRTEISQYHEPIPEFVLNKAIQIKRAIPEVELFVEYLEMRSDPFLLAKLGQGKKGSDWDADWEYIEVWAEPKFEGRGR